MKKKKQKKELTIFAKLAIVLACVSVLLIITFLLREWAPVANFRRMIDRAVNSIFYNGEKYDSPSDKIFESEGFAKIDKNVPFHVPRPYWLPEGYKLVYADYVLHDTGDYTIKVQYRGKDGHIIEFSVTTVISIEGFDIQGPYETIYINNFEIYLLDPNEEFTSALYIDNNQGLQFSLISIDKETLIKILESIE